LSCSCDTLPEEYKLVNIPARTTSVVLLCCGVSRLIVRLSSSQMQKTVSVSLTSLKRVSFLRFFFVFFKTSVALVCSVVKGGGFRSFGYPSTQEILSLPRALTYEAERTLDLPRHGAARACPWLSTALVIGSVRRERGGDLYSQRRS